MYETSIWQIADLLLRGGFTQGGYMPLALQLVAWVRLSKLGRLQGELAFVPSKYPQTAGELKEVFNRIVQTEGLGANSMAFAYISPEITNLSSGLLIRSLELLEMTNLEEPWPIEKLVNTINTMVGKEGLGAGAELPQELSWLMVALAQLRTSMKAYLPFESGFQISATVQSMGVVPYVETSSAGAIPWLINLLSDSHIHAHVGDPIRSPGFLENGRLSRFDVGLSFPPLGMRYEIQLAEQDRFGRFPEKTASISVLAVRNLLARTTGRIVVAVPNSLLFSRGGEYALRIDLLDKCQVEAVIALPPALLAGAALPFSILVLRNDQPCEQVLFVNAENPDLFEKGGKGRAVLIGWSAIAKVVEERIECQFSKLVAVNEVRENDAQMQANRYCMTSDGAEIDVYFKKHPYKSLGELVNFVRPIAKQNESEGVTAIEIGPAEFPEFGYASPTGRTVVLSEAVVQKSSKQFLRSNDIAVTVKGSVGKVAIFPLNIREEESLLVIGQSCLILRIREPDQLDPRVLFAFLKSEIGQAQLRHVVSGASVPLIQLRDLEKIRVPIFDRKTQAEVVADFEKVAEIEDEIERLREIQRNLSNAVWNN